MADWDFPLMVDCDICYMEHPASEVGLMACKHQYCAGCLAMTFKTQKDGPKCPEPSCGAKATADELRAIIEL